MPIYSYGTVFALGHRMVQDIFKSEVQIEEKMDGSQISFGILDGELQCRSKGKQITMESPEKIFARAVETIKKIAAGLQPDIIYRGECLNSRHHNTLTYAREPKGNVIIYDISSGIED